MIHREQLGISCLAMPRRGQPVSSEFSHTQEGIFVKEIIYFTNKINEHGIDGRLLRGAICMKQQKGMPITHILVGII